MLKFGKSISRRRKEENVTLFEGIEIEKHEMIVCFTFRIMGHSITSSDQGYRSSVIWSCLVCASLCQEYVESGKTGKMLNSRLSSYRMRVLGDGSLYLRIQV